MPIWVDFMDIALQEVPEDPWRTPPGLSYIKVNKDTGKPTEKLDENSYFELFIDEAN